MKIYDESLKNELTSPDMEKGYLVFARRIVVHHDAVERAFHYEVMTGTVSEECPEGLRCEIEDVAAKEPWDEYEEVQKYVLYTADELAEIAKKKAEEQEAIKQAEAAAAAKAQAEAEQAEKISRIDAIDAQVTYTAMMTDTLMVEEEA